MWPDFQLSDLVDLYLEKMAPVVKFEETDLSTGRIQKIQVSLLYWYVKFMTIFDANTAATRKYHDELFGVGELEFVPELYNDYSFLREVHLTEEAYNALDLHTRARMRAQYVLQNIIELRNTHLRIMKERLDRRAQEAEDKAKAENKKK